MRGLVLLSAGALALSGSVWGTTVAEADACVQVITTGTLLGSNTTSQCVPWSGGLECAAPEADLDPLGHVYVTLCVPF